MSRSKLCSACFVLLGVVSSAPFYAHAGTRSATGAAASLVAFEIAKTVLPPLAPSPRKIATVNGSVTTATRTLDLNALKADDFGDEPPATPR